MFGKKSWRFYSFGILTLLTGYPLDFYSKLTDGLVVSAGYPNGAIQLKYFFVYSKKLFCHGNLNFVFTRNQLSEEKIAKSMDWFLYDNGLRHERVDLDVEQHLQ